MCQTRLYFLVCIENELDVVTCLKKTFFAEGYWKELSSESAVLARIFVEHCVSIKNEARLESASLPVVTAFAFIVQETYNALLAILEEMETAKLLRAGLEEEEDEEMEEELTKREVIMGELLKMVLKLDYGDEIGRRKVFSVVSECFWILLFFAFLGLRLLLQRICSHIHNFRQASSNVASMF